MCRVPLYGWVALGFSAWCAVSVPAGISAGRWFRRRRAVAGCSPERQHVVRRSNERLLTAAQEARTGAEAAFVFLCECQDELCREYVRLTLAQYDSERARRGRILYPGHAPVEDEPMAAEATGAGRRPSSSRSSGARRLPN
jgi:hypothetical protein